MEGWWDQNMFEWRIESHIRIGVGFSPQLASLQILNSCQQRIASCASIAIYLQTVFKVG